VATPLFSGLIAPNATVDVVGLTSTQQDDAGGNDELYDTTHAEDVPCLVSLTNGVRDGSFGGRFSRATGTLSGDDDSLTLVDTRVVFKTCSIAALVGLVAEVRTLANHSPSPCGFVPRKVTLTWTQIGYAEAN